MKQPLVLSAIAGISLATCTTLIPVDAVIASSTSITSSRGTSIVRSAMRPISSRVVRPSTVTRSSRLPSSTKRNTIHSSAATGTVTSAASAIIAAELIDELGDLVAPDTLQAMESSAVTEGKQPEPEVVLCKHIEPAGCSLPNALFRPHRIVPFDEFVEEKTGFRDVRVTGIQVIPNETDPTVMSGLVHFVR